MSFSVATINVNGIRAAVKIRSEENRGLLPWLESTTADVVLLQEVRASEAQTQEALGPALDAGWHLAQAVAAAPGRAGVAILSRTPLRDVVVGFGHEGNPGWPGASEAAREFDGSGRYIEATVDAALGSSGTDAAVGAADPADGHGSGGTQPVRVASLYLPSGSAKTAKQDEKYRFLDAFAPYLHQLADSGQQVIVGGDWNICHRRQDLKNWRTNRTKSGFLPAERAFLDHLIGVVPDAATQVGDATDSGRAGNPGGAPSEFFGAVDYRPGDLAAARLQHGAACEPAWVDVVRSLHPQEDGPYSWWTFRGQAFDTDAGWRIDLQVATRDLAARARRAWVDRAAAYELRWSDHSPVLVEYA